MTSLQPSVGQRPTLADAKVGVHTEDAHEMTRRLAAEEGLLVGPSSGAAGQPSSIRLARGAYDAIASEAARSYPLEACGALLGREEDAISEAFPLANRETGQASRRFVIAPADYLATEESADARGLRLLGFWHSHPDHPARPSGTDREYAWPGLLTVVVAVEQGRPREITAWDVPGADQPFRRRDLVFEAE